MDKVNILGVFIDKYNIEETSDKIINHLENGGEKMCVYTPNSEILMMAYKDEKFRDVLNRADILTADGIGVVYASKILSNPIASRAAGYDIARRVVEKGAPLEKSVYIFGAKPGVAKTAAENLENEYEGIRIAGYHDGYFDDKEEKKIIEDIKSKKPDILMVGLGAPKQEKWIDAHKDELEFGVCMGIGGSIDVFAGTVKRAPEFYQKHGIEWLYRFAKQPSRVGRMMQLPKFGFTVLFKGRKFKQER